MNHVHISYFWGVKLALLIYNNLKNRCRYSNISVQIPSNGQCFKNQNHEQMYCVSGRKRVVDILSMKQNMMLRQLKNM